MTTLLLTERISRQDRGAEGELVLYGSSCSQLTQEAEYVKKVFPCSFQYLQYSEGVTSLNTGGTAGRTELS